VTVGGVALEAVGRPGSEKCVRDPADLGRLCPSFATVLLGTIGQAVHLMVDRTGNCDFDRKRDPETEHR
jgi:hypothetical protein